MLSSEDDRICSSSVWEETSFWLNKKTVNKIIIILLKTCIFSYWTITCPCHVSQNFKNTLTMLLSGVDRICTSSVWEETPFWWKKKDRKWIDNHSFKTSTFSYWTRMCHVSHSLKYTFTMLLSGWTKCAGLLSNRRGAYFVTPGPRRLSVETKWPYVESVYEYEYTNGLLFCSSKSKVYWTSVLYRATLKLLFNKNFLF